jgi:putative ABC transport system permease protein
MKLVAAGGVVGLILSALLAQLLSSLLFGITALDPLTFIGVPTVLGAVALLASWLPARRAARVNPVAALKSD